MCSPVAATPPFDTPVSKTSATLLSHVIVAAPDASPWTLFAVEWVTGEKVAVAASVIHFIADTTGRSFLFVDTEGQAKYCKDALCSVVVNLTPDNVTVFASAANPSLLPQFSSDSSKVFLLDKTQNSSAGIWIVPVDNPDAAVRVSDPAHSDIRSIALSPDSSTVCYVNGTFDTARLFCVSALGGTIRDLSVPGAGGVNYDTAAFSPNSAFVSYMMLAAGASYRVFVTGVNGTFADAVEVSLPNGTGTVIHDEPIFTPDSTHVIFRSSLRIGGQTRWVSSQCTTNTLHPLSMASTGTVFSSYAVFGSEGFAHSARVPNNTARPAVWRINASDNADVTGATQISISGPGGAQSVVGMRNFLLYTGDLITRGVIELFAVPLNVLNNISTATTKITPDGDVDVVFPVASTLKVLYRWRFKTAYVVDLAKSFVGFPISRPSDSVLVYSPSPNGVSAVYFTTNASDVFTTCLVAPLIVAPNATVVLNTSAVEGHFVMQANSSIVVVTTTVVTIGGTAFLNGGGLKLANCESATLSISASNVIGSFGSISSDACVCQLITSDAVYTSTSALISFHVQGPDPKCTSVGGVITNNSTSNPSGTSSALSTGAIVGIVVGAVVGGVCIAVAIVLLSKFLSHRYTEKSQIQLRQRALSQANRSNPAYGAELKSEEL